MSADSTAARYEPKWYAAADTSDCFRRAGTLDPFATGVLLLLVGKATKLCERLMDQPKQYEATVKLGATTATDDPESPEQPFRGTGASPVSFHQTSQHGRGARATKEE